MSYDIYAAKERNKSQKTKAELEALHGTPDEFRKACQKACLDGYITADEMHAAIEKYRIEYVTAPEPKSDHQEAQCQNDEIQNSPSTAPGTW